jgi:hypothetical protein
MLLAVPAEPTGGSLDERLRVIIRYIAQALRRARYRVVDDRLSGATVTGLPGVIATGRTSRSAPGQRLTRPADPPRVM